MRAWIPTDRMLHTDLECNSGIELPTMSHGNTTKVIQFPALPSEIVRRAAGNDKHLAVGPAYAD